MKCSSYSHHSTCEPSITSSVPTYFITCDAMSVKIGCHCMNRLTQPHFNNLTDRMVPFALNYKEHSTIIFPGLLAEEI